MHTQHTWFQPTMASLLAASLVILATFIYLYATHRRRYILLWSGCWTALAGLHLLLLLGVPPELGAIPVLGVLACTLAAPLLMYWGTCEFTERRPPRILWAAALALAVWIAYGASTGMPFFPLSLPVFAFTGLAYILAGRALIAFGHEYGRGSRLAGWILVLMGLHQFGHPFLHLMDWIPHAGLLASTALFVCAALAIVMAHFDRARLDLARSEARFRALAENSPDIIWTTDQSLRLTYVSPSVLAMGGYTPEEVLRMPLEGRMTPDSLARLRQAVRERDALEDQGPHTDLNKPLRLELEHLHKDGHTIWTEITTSRMRDSEGRLTGIIGLTRDISQRRDMEQRQARQAKADAALLELSHMLVRRIESIHVLAEHVLAAARDHTDCLQGFVSEVDPATGDNVAHTLATEMQAADIPGGMGRRIAFARQDDGLYRGLFGHALNTREPFYTNDPGSHPASITRSGGMPEWHIPITNFLTAPAVVDGEVLGQIALANAPRPFTDEDLACVTRMANFYALAVQRKRSEDSINASLEEKKILLQEIHHRVKNNLQIISGLLYLQADLVSDPASLEMFQESQQRIASMALVHEELYRSQDLSLVDMSDYCSLLAERLLRTLAPGRDIACRVDVEAFSLAVDKAVPCGLLLNELLTNAVKHAFADGRAGRITIGGGQDDGLVWLRVADNGVGLPPDMDPAAMPSLGMQLVANLSQQLHARLGIDGRDGAVFLLEFEP